MTERPLKDELRAPFDDRDVHRMWARFDASRSRPRQPILPWVVATAAAVVALVALLSHPADPAPLRTKGGAELVLRAPLSPGLLELDDDSRISVDLGAELVPLVSSPREVAFLLEEGRATWTVTPGGSRRWTIECGLARVEVVGTRFSIDRRVGRVEVEVEEGTVLVRSSLLQTGLARVSGGERLVVEAPRPPAVDSKPPPAAPPPVSAPRSPSDKPAKPRSEVEPKEEEPPRAEESVPQLLAEADDERRAGRYEAAAGRFEEILSEHASDPRAGLAAFSLGKIEREVRDRPGAAAVAFQRALALGLPAALVEDAYVRLVDAHLAAGDREAAESAAQLHHARFPNGRSTARIDRRLEAP